MPKLRRLSGQEVVRIFENFGFEVIRIRGSHHVMRRMIGNEKHTINIPVHGKTPLGQGLLRRIYRDASRYLSEQELTAHFYTD